MTEDEWLDALSDAVAEKVWQKLKLMPYPYIPPAPPVDWRQPYQPYYPMPGVWCGTAQTAPGEDWQSYNGVGGAGGAPFV